MVEPMEQDRPPRVAPSLAPEHDWAAAEPLLRPALRPVGTAGTDGREPRVPATNSGPGKTVVRPGPAGLTVVYVLPGAGFDVVVNVEHLLAWGVDPDRVHAAAMANLGEWSSGAAWVDEIGGARKIVWSDWGGGMDAARILLDDVRGHLLRALAPARRILVGIPERDLLIAAGLSDGDDEFATQFARYVAGRAETADDSIDARIFELFDGELVDFRAD
jgi:hypothetical protein